MPDLDLERRIAASFGMQGLMKTFGAELGLVRKGEVQIVLAARPELSQQHGFLHAGALTAILDTACGYAALTVAPPGHDVLAVEFKLNFLRPAVADRFVAIGKVRRRGKTLTVCAGEVVGERGPEREMIALMQGTIMNVPADAPS